MPYKSLKQERFFHTKTGMAKVGKKTVDEFDQASKGMDLPEEAAPAKPKSNRYTDMLKQDDTI